MTKAGPVIAEGAPAFFIFRDTVDIGTGKVAVERPYQTSVPVTVPGA
jgi:hypothetical protein